MNRLTKLVTSAAVCAAMTAAACVPAFAANTKYSFNDISDSQYSWCAAQIQKMYEQGYITGYEDNTYRPDNEVTRQECLSLFARAMGSSSKLNAEILKLAKEQYGETVDSYGLKWGQDDIAYLMYRGALKKTDLDTYLKDDEKSKPMKRYEAAIIITKAMGGDKTAAAAGNVKLMKKLGLSYAKPKNAGTEIHVAVDGSYAGYILISDVVKEHSVDAISGLKRSGIKTVMLTGDSKRVAEHVASQLGVDVVKSELLPADKVDEVEKLLAKKNPKEKLAFVGDGINDAPVLSRADLGIAMGAMGSDAAIEAADIVLMDDDPAKIALAMRISRKTLRIVYENIVFALVIKALCLVFGALGIANMWWAIFADVGVMVLAVLNATRALRVADL